MSVRPIDLQVMLPQLTEAARAHGSDMERQLLASQRGEINAKHMVEADTKEVHSKKTVQKVTMNEKNDENRKKKNNGKKSNSNGLGYTADGKKESAGKSQSTDRMETSHFIDVKL